MSGPGDGPASGVDPFEHDDASYLLGTLDGASRAAFEAHLSGCPACAARVAALRPVVGALAAGGDAVRDALARSLEPAAEPVAEPGVPSIPRADRVAELAGLVERRRRRTRWAFGGLATVAAAAIAALAVVVAVPTNPANPAPPAAAEQMTATGAAAIRATADIEAAPWGSEITVDCSYSGDSPYASGNIYALQVVDRSGRTEAIGSWTLAQGAEVRFVGGTALSPDRIRAVNVIEPDGTVVLRLSV